jgi:hypothetical protein
MASKLPFEEQAAKAAALVSAGKTIASKFPNVTASIPNPAAALNLGATLDSIKSGAAFNKATSAISDIAGIGASLPADALASVSGAATSLTTAMNAAKANLSRDLGVTLTNLNMTNKLSFASSGAAPSAASIEATLGPLAVMKNGPDMLKEQASKLAGSVTGALSGAFGAGPLPGADLIASAKSAGALAASFASTVPAKTITDPDLGVITNPAYTAFASIPGNATKLTSIDSLTSGAASAASEMTSKMADLQSAGAAALASATTNIKAMSLANTLGSPLPVDVTKSLDKMVDITAVDTTAIKEAAKITVPLPKVNLTGLSKLTG